MRREDSSGMWRVFCAIELPADVRTGLMVYIKQLREQVPQVRASWSRPESIHLTLKFIGEIPLTKVESLTRAAERAANGLTRFRLGVGGTGVFPTHGAPRVLWIGIQDPSGKLAELHARLEDESAKLGFEKETRPFHPHLTLARLRRPGLRVEQPPRSETQSARVLTSAHKEMRFPPAEITVSELLVIRSELSSEGSKYTVISRHPLGTSDEL